MPGWLRRALAEGLGGVCLFGHNITDPDQLRRLTAEVRGAAPHAVIAVDEEGGDVTRLHAGAGSPFPGNAVLGRLDDVDLTAAVAAAVAAEVRAAGCDLTLAPVVDVNSQPDNPVIGTRSFGADPGLVAAHGAAWVHGAQCAGVAATAKHFPGHGDTTTDSHLARPVATADRATLHARELAPFRAAVAAGVAAVMTSHIVLPALDPDRPATTSPAVLDLLRGELGFTGAVVSDALDMAGATDGAGAGATAVAALAAGCDLLCLGAATTGAELAEVVDAVAAALADGTLDRDRLDASAARVRALLARPAGASPPAATGGPGTTAAGRPGTTAAGRPGTTAAGPPPTTSGPAPRVPGPAEVLPAVEVSAAARARLRAPGPRVLLRLDTEANIAVGTAPWGPFAALADAVADADADAGGIAGLDGAALTDGGPDPRPEVRTAGAPGWLDLPADAVVVAVGRDNHRHPRSRHLLDDLRARRPDAVVVDMGWPSPARDYADVATFGASRLMGAALLELITPARP
ncbi:beta-N-acetylhexosaminidase [Georgenia sp. TF02-10]|nr:beta-N-acetylhexosaminidase [Georgenia sp. TF02-10]